MTYLCPVCGFHGLEEPPTDYNICDCCGTEFGNDDKDKTVEQLRREWIVGGMRWFSTFYPPPANWSAIEQLQNLGRGAVRLDKVSGLTESSALAEPTEEELVVFSTLLDDALDSARRTLKQAERYTNYLQATHLDMETARDIATASNELAASRGRIGVA